MTSGASGSLAGMPMEFTARLVKARGTIDGEPFESSFMDERMG
jgi:hypothetical protein